MSYLQRLADLDPAASLIAPAENRLMLLTGQSSFASSRLSPAQAAFLEAVAPSGAEILAAGFPFHRDLDCATGSEPTMLAASVRNAQQVVWSLGSQRFRAVTSRVLQQAIDHTGSRLMIVTGSCGLQLANAVWPGVQVREGLRVQILALGPACFGELRLAGAAVTVIQGMSDYWSRLFYRGPVHTRCAGGHLDYWASSDVRQLVAALLLAGAEAR